MVPPTARLRHLGGGAFEALVRPTPRQARAAPPEVNANLTEETPRRGHRWSAAACRGFLERRVGAAAAICGRPPGREGAGPRRGDRGFDPPGRRDRAECDDTSSSRRTRFARRGGVRREFSAASQGASSSSRVRALGDRRGGARRRPAQAPAGGATWIDGQPAQGRRVRVGVWLERGAARVGRRAAAPPIGMPIGGDSPGEIALGPRGGHRVRHEESPLATRSLRRCLALDLARRRRGAQRPLFGGDVRPRHHRGSRDRPRGTSAGQVSSSRDGASMGGRGNRPVTRRG